jgi:hypothetical protein
MSITSTPRDDVVELMVRYGVAIDRKDWAGFRACFTPDVEAVYEGFGTYHGHDELEGFVRPAVTSLDATQHLFSNFLVQLDGDSAQFQCYVQATHVKLATPGGNRFTVGGPYDNHAVLTPEGWKMDRFRFWATWTDGNDAVLHHVDMDENVPR